MFKYVLAVIAALSITTVGFAQKTTQEKVSGTVKTTDGKPAGYISVSLKNTTLGDITDRNGRFEFSAPSGEYTMVVHSILAHRKEFSVTIKSGENNYFPDITIIESENQLNEVVITGQFTPQSLRNSLYKVKVINNQTIQQKASTDTKSLLNTELGIRISNDMALGESDFELMGMSGNNVKVLIDGVPVIDRGATKQSLSQIDINTIEQIEIVEGPMSVTYGTDALAGVINIITKKPKVSDDKNSYSISARLHEESVGNEYDFLSGQGIHNQRVKAAWASKTGFYVNGGYTRNVTDGWIGNQTGREKKWNPKDQYFYEGTLGYKIKSLNVWYRLNYLDETIYTPANPTELNPNEVVDKDFLVDRYTHSLQADWKLNTNLALNLVSSFQDYKRRTKTVVTDTDTGEKWLSSDESSQDISKCQAYFLRATAAWTLTPELSLQPGVEYSWDKGSGDRIDGEPEIATLAAFLSAEWKPLDWLSLRPGIRTILSADYDAPFTIPSILTKFALNDNMDLRLSYAYGFRAPTLRELYFSFYNANHDIIGNPDLKAEYSNSYIGSFTWRILHNEDIRLTSTLSGFYNDYKDRISLVTNAEKETQNIYKNIDRYKTIGGTFENSVIWRNLQAGLAFSLVGRYNSYSDNETYKNENLPEFKFSPEITGTASYHIEKTKTNLNLFYKFTGRKQEYRVNSGELYLAQLGSYNTADFTVSQNAGEYLTINAGIKNIFNVKMIDNTSVGSGHSSSGPSLVGCGRSFFVGVNYLLNR